jgi:hypothetical protein
MYHVASDQHEAAIVITCIIGRGFHPLASCCCCCCTVCLRLRPATCCVLQGVSCYHGQEQLQGMVATCDVLVCLLPLTPSTEGQ